MPSLSLCLAAVLTTPFVDGQLRFSLDLPEGWAPVAEASNDESVVFRRVDDRLVAHAAVRLLPAPRGTTVGGAVRDIELVLSREPGFKLLDETRAGLGVLDAVRLRYVHYINNDPRYPKMAEDRVALAGQALYIVHVETLADAFAPFEADFEKLFSSFRVGGQALASLKASLVASPLVGRWQLAGGAGTVFELRRDGTFDLAGTSGRFRLQGRRLYTKPDGGIEEAFEWSIVGGTLTLTSPSLGEPMRYRKLEAANEGGRRGPERGASPGQ